MAKQDLRGFIYELEPARLRAQHRLDAAMAKLMLARQLHQNAVHALEHHRDAMAVLARRIRLKPESIVEPWRELAAAHHWRQRQSEGERLEELLRQQVANLSEVTEELRAAQVQVEAFDGHRCAAMEAHLVQVASREQRAQDQEWMAHEATQRQTETQLLGWGKQGW